MKNAIGHTKAVLLRLSLGLGFCFLVQGIAIWGGMSLGSLMEINIRELALCWTLPLLISLTIPLIITIASSTSRQIVSRRSVSSVAGSIFIVGFALLACPLVLESATQPCLVAAACIIGMAIGILLVLWQDCLSHLSSNGAVGCLLVASIISSFCFLLLSLIPPLIRIASTAIVSIVSLVLRVTLIKEISCHPDCKESLSIGNKTRIDTAASLDIGRPPGEPSSKTLFAKLRKPIICMCAIAAAVSLTRYVALSSPGKVDNINLTANIILLVISTIFFILYVKVVNLKRNESFISKLDETSVLLLYRFAFPLVATGLLLVAFNGKQFGLPVTTLTYAVFFYASILVMAVSISVACAMGSWCPRIFSTLSLGMYLTFALVTLAECLFLEVKQASEVLFAVIAFAAFYILTMSFFALQERRARLESTDPSDADGANDARALRVPAQDNPVVIDKVEHLCDLLSEKYSLTDREHDVVLLIARGRDVPTIAIQLGLSVNTVRSYSKGAYRKLGIHSKQGLLDLLEAIDLSK